MTNLTIVRYVSQLPFYSMVEKNYTERCKRIIQRKNSELWDIHSELWDINSELQENIFCNNFFAELQENELWDKK